MPSVIAYAVTFVLVLSAIVFIVLFGPAPRFRYVFLTVANRRLMG